MRDNGKRGPRWMRRIRSTWERKVRRNWKRWLPVLVFLSVSIALVAAFVTWGVYDSISLHCRSKTDPSVSGVEFCIRPATQPSAKSRG